MSQKKKKNFKIPTNKISNECRCIIFSVHERLFVFVFMNISLCLFVFFNVRFRSLPKTNKKNTNEHEQVYFLNKRTQT
ncbi:hypothetical protein Hanom_Chr17g01536781 [Helianthus anomalus]